ncbi:MAG: glycosyltransferase family 2 protein [Bacteroidetes bacterium]|nr:glycosyltransferase family 2 protein [Bacteroidota bacterium]
MDLSVVIPLLNEEESLKELSDWITRVAETNQISCEIIFVDDGSRDKSWQVIESLAATNSHIRGIKFRRNYGKSAALNTGFQAAKGDIIITMDADLQDSPDEIPDLVRMIREEGYDLVSGWKRKRHDPIIKRWPSKFYNWTTRRISGIMLHDFNCGLKAYRADVVKNIEVYGEMHRYIPVIAKRAGFGRIGEKVVAHQKRPYGYTKFGWERFITGYLDLLSIAFVTKFGKRPMHFFGTIGSLFFLGGGLISLWLIGLKIFHVIQNTKIRGITDQPLFFLALVAMIIGAQLFLTGFLAELVSRNSPDRNQYQVEKEV